MNVNQQKNLQKIMLAFDKPTGARQWQLSPAGIWLISLMGRGTRHETNTPLIAARWKTQHPRYGKDSWYLKIEGFLVHR